MRSGVVVSLVVVAAAVGSLGCFDGLFGDGGDGGGLGGLLDPKPPAPPAPQPLCEGFTLPKASFDPLERVALDVRLREDLQALTPPIAAQVKYEGSDEVLWAHVMLSGAEGQERYMLVIPPSARLWEPSKAQITLEVLVEDGASVNTCTGEGMITIAGLKEAPGTLAALIPRSRRLLELQAGRLGLTLADLAAADPRALPAVAQPLVMALHLLEGSDHPNSLAKIAAGQAQDQATLGQGLKLAEALLAAGRHPEELEATIAVYEALPPAPPLTLEPQQPRSFRPEGLDDPCAAARHLQIGGAETLSNYMREGDVARRWAADLRDPYDSKGAGYAAITGLGQIPFIGDNIDDLPIAGQALSIVGTGLTTTINYREFLSKVYPSDLFSPSVDVSRDMFEEDSPEVGIWTDYRVSARSEGGDFSKLAEDLASDAVDALVPVIPVEKLLKYKGNAKLKGELLQELKDEVKGQIEDAAGTQLKEKIVNPFIQSKKLCKIPERVWGPIDITAKKFSDVEYARPLTDLSNEDREAFAPLVSAGTQGDDAFRRGFKLKALAGGGTGQIILRPNRFEFPPASNRLTGGLTTNVEVPPIKVELVPAYKRVAPGGEEVIVAEVEDALDRAVEIEVYAGDATCTPAMPDRDGEGNRRFLCKFGSDPDADFPVRIAARSLARGGAVNPDLPAVAYGTYITGPQLEIEPGTVCVAKDKSQRFTAKVEGAQDTGVTWTASGGKITASGDFSSNKPGSYLITAKLKEDPKVVATASVTVGACKCPWSARVMGPLPYVSGGFTDITAIWEPTLQNLQITATDKRGLRFVVIAPGVPWGAVGVFGAKGNAALPGAAGVVDSFDAPALLKDGGLTRSELSIESWDGNKLKGRYQGSSVFFASQALDAPLAAELELQFDMVVSTTGVLDVLTNSCIEED